MIDTTLGGMARMLTQIAATVPAVEHAALDYASRVILEECKAEIGHYQARAGRFAAWAPLAEMTKRQRVALGFTPDEPGLRTGAMRDSYERTVRAREAWVGSNDMHAVWFELGTRTQPPRSVIGMAAMHKRDEIRAATGRIFYGALISGGAVQAVIKQFSR